MLEDGVHVCSLGSYGGVATYVEFMRRLSDMGLPMTENRALRNSFLAQPAVYLRRRRHAEHRRRRRRDPLRLVHGFGVPTDADYQWAEQLHPDPLLKQMPPLVADAHKMSVATPEKRREAMRSPFAAGRHELNALWPNLFVAEIKGLAMLRNRTPAEPIDWVKVIFDYGRFGGRTAHRPSGQAGHDPVAQRTDCLDGLRLWLARPARRPRLAHAELFAQRRGGRRPRSTYGDRARRHGPRCKTRPQKDLPWIKAQKRSVI